MNSMTVRVSFWLRLVNDDDEANPWIITSHHGVPNDATNANLIAATSTNPPPLLWNLWHMSNTTSPGTGGLRAAMPVGIEWYRAECQWRLAAGQGDATGTSEYEVPGTQPGGARAGAMAPQPLAVVVRKSVASGLKKHRGRNYLPAIVGDINTDGSTVVASRTTIAAGYTALLSNTFLTETYPLIVAGSDGVNRLVSAFDVAPTIGVQRRRLR